MTRFTIATICLVALLGWAGDGAAEVDVDDTPSLEMTTVDGNSIALKDWRGKVVLVDFWASWCAPCRASFPFYQSLSEKYGEQFRIVAISVDEETDNVEEFLDEYDVSFPVAIDSDHTVASRFEPPTMPTSYLIGPEGRVRLVHEGFEEADKAKIREKIDALIEEAQTDDADNGTDADQ